MLAADALGQRCRGKIGREHAARGDQRRVLVAGGVRVHVDALAALDQALDRRPGFGRQAGLRVQDRRGVADAVDLDGVLDVGALGHSGRLVVDGEQHRLWHPPTGGRRIGRAGAARGELQLLPLRRRNSTGHRRRDRDRAAAREARRSRDLADVRLLERATERDGVRGPVLLDRHVSATDREQHEFPKRALITIHVEWLDGVPTRCRQLFPFRKDVVSNVVLLLRRQFRPNACAFPHFLLLLRWQLPETSLILL